jgi:hypothetical protein
MSISMYDVSVPVLIRGLRVISSYLDKAVAYAEEKGFDPGVLVNARLAPDMASLAGQVQRASDTSKAAMSRLTGIAAPSFPDTEKTIPELKERVEKTIAFLESVKPDNFQGSEDKSIEMKFGNSSTTLTGKTFVLSFLLPNFFFHVTTFHDILRHNGMKVGKRDYLGALQ